MRSNVYVQSGILFTMITKSNLLPGLRLLVVGNWTGHWFIVISLLQSNSKGHGYSYSDLNWLGHAPAFFYYLNPITIFQSNF